MKNPNDLSTATILRLARARIADPRHWCQQHLAVNALGMALSPNADSAVRWCAAGAVARVADWGGAWDYAGPRLGAAFRALHTAAKALYGVSEFVTVNDFYGHEAMLRVYDHAIKTEEYAHAKS
jgi:hypothetical protein